MNAEEFNEKHDSIYGARKVRDWSESMMDRNTELFVARMLISSIIIQQAEESDDDR